MSPRTTVALLATALSALAVGPASASSVLVMNDHGGVRRQQDRFLPARQAEPAAPRGAAARSQPSADASSAPQTPPALRALLGAGAIDQPTYDRAIGDVRRATQLTHRLTGARRAALRGVLADLDGMARRGEVVPARLPALLATLEANIRWWTTGPLLAPGARIEFAGSDIVWQHYAGHGIQIQWLGTWGKANGLWQSGDHDRQLGDLVAEAVSLAGQRGGGLAFEYLFTFDGGAPPWVSGLAQGTALSALVRAGARLNNPEWRDAARSALGIFRTPPPEGIAQPTAAGTHYLQYSFAPRLHVLNGFIQSLNGLFDLATRLKDPEGQALFDAGRAEAASELPSYDTGGWSRYSQYRDSDLSYHALLRQFLGGLCDRLRATGGDGEPFCLYSYRFRMDLLRAPRLVMSSPSPRTPRARRGARVRFTIDKPGTVTMTIRRGAFVHRAVVAVASGPHSFGWKPPRAGRYAVTLFARDLPGHTSALSASTTVLP